MPAHKITNPFRRDPTRSDLKTRALSLKDRLFRPAARTQDAELIALVPQIIEARRAAEEATDAWADAHDTVCDVPIPDELRSRPGDSDIYGLPRGVEEGATVRLWRFAGSSCMYLAHMDALRNLEALRVRGPVLPPYFSRSEQGVEANPDGQARIDEIVAAWDRRRAAIVAHPQHADLARLSAQNDAAWDAYKLLLRQAWETPARTRTELVAKARILSSAISRGELAEASRDEGPTVPDGLALSIALDLIDLMVGPLAAKEA